ncbi:MAG: N-acetyltransferase, partial [Dokdonella sp.]
MLVVEQLKPKLHDRDGFECGEPSLDAYLRQQAAQHHRDAISTTHVLVDDANPSRILGYYSLSAAQLLLTDLQDAERERLPSYPVPAIRMGRLAVLASEHGKGHGDYLIAHAVARCLALREQLGVRVLLV